MASKKDEILKMLDEGRSLNEILEKGYNKKYTKEVIREYRKNNEGISEKLSTSQQEDIAKEVQEIRAQLRELQKNKLVIDTKVPDVYDKLQQVKELIECIQKQKTYLDDVSIEFKISIGNNDSIVKEVESYKINPIEIYRKTDEVTLRNVLETVPIEGLKDIAKQYTPDVRGYVYKWSDITKVIDYIVERAIGLAQKGSVFVSHNQE